MVSIVLISHDPIFGGLFHDLYDIDFSHISYEFMLLKVLAVSNLFAAK